MIREKTERPTEIETIHLRVVDIYEAIIETTKNANIREVLKGPEVETVHTNMKSQAIENIEIDKLTNETIRKVRENNDGDTTETFDLIPLSLTSKHKLFLMTLTQKNV